VVAKNNFHSARCSCLAEWIVWATTRRSDTAIHAGRRIWAKGSHIKHVVLSSSTAKTATELILELVVLLQDCYAPTGTTEKLFF
jgi:hypothetical protein